jgi:hypothetical protein
MLIMRKAYAKFMVVSRKRASGVALVCLLDDKIITDVIGLLQKLLLLISVNGKERKARVILYYLVERKRKKLYKRIRWGGRSRYNMTLKKLERFQKQYVYIVNRYVLCNNNLFRRKSTKGLLLLSPYKSYKNVFLLKRTI